MHLEKLVTVLKAFDEAQLKRLKDYVNSPYFKIPPQAALLLERLIPLHPRFPEKKLDPKILGRKDQRLCTLAKQSNAGSYLLQAAKQFIAQEQWQKNENEIERLKLKGFQELSLTSEYERGFEKQMEKINADPEKDIDIFFERHVLTQLSLSGFNAKLQRSARNDVMPIVQSLDEFYALKKLRLLCEALNRQQVFGTNYDDQHIPTLLKILEPYTNPKYPYVYLFVNVYRMMTEPTYAESNLYYKLIKQYIELHGSSPISQSIWEAKDYAIGCCLRWLNRGYDDAGREYLWWIEWKAKNDLLLQNGKLSPITFRNIITTSISTRTPDWINQIITVYAPFLPDEYHDTYLAFARGLHQYTLKNYEKAIRYFLRAQAKEEVIFNSIIRQWQGICLYESDKNDTDTFYNHLLSFEKHLTRNKKELRHLAGAFDLFIEYSRKLIKAVSSETLDLDFIELQNQEHFAGKPWLVKQFLAKKQKTHAQGARVKK
jgi:hypothetical protein